MRPAAAITALTARNCAGSYGCYGCAIVELTFNGTSPQPFPCDVSSVIGGFAPNSTMLGPIPAPAPP